MNLDELTKLEQAMTPGTWAVKPGDGYWRVDGSTGEVFDDGSAGGEYATTCSEDDRDGICALRNAAPELIAAAKQRDELAALLRECRDYLEDYGTGPLIGDITAALARLEGEGK